MASISTHALKDASDVSRVLLQRSVTSVKKGMR